MCWWCGALRWRHNGRDCVSNHQRHNCLLSRLFGRRSKKTLELRVTGLCVGNSPGTDEFPEQMASNAENVSIWWRHHGGGGESEPRLANSWLSTSHFKTSCFCSFTEISIDFVSNAPSYTDWHKAWNLCTGTWGHASSDIAARVGVAQETSSILLKQAATASLELGKSIGAPRKTTARQECALFRMVREDHFKGAVPSLRGWVICMECVLVVRRLTTDLWPEDTVLAG